MPLRRGCVATSSYSRTHAGNRTSRDRVGRSLRVLASSTAAQVASTTKASQGGRRFLLHVKRGVTCTEATPSWRAIPRVDPNTCTLPVKRKETRSALTCPLQQQRCILDAKKQQESEHDGLGLRRHEHPFELTAEDSCAPFHATLLLRCKGVGEVVRPNCFALRRTAGGTTRCELDLQRTLEKRPRCPFSRVSWNGSVSNRAGGGEAEGPEVPRGVRHLTVLAENFVANPTPRVCQEPAARPGGRRRRAGRVAPVPGGPEVGR